MSLYFWLAIIMFVLWAISVAGHQAYKDFPWYGPVHLVWLLIIALLLMALLGSA